MSLDSRVRQIAEELRDTKPLAKLSGGDMVPIDAQCHLRCLAAFYGRGRSRKRRSNEAPHHINAFTEVVSYICGDLNVIKKLYCDFLQKIDLQRNSKIIFQHLNLILPSLLLSFRKDVDDALLDACNFDSDDEAMMLMRGAKLVRKEIFEVNYHFSCSLTDGQYN